jgi:hypothetical protein
MMVQLGHQWKFRYSKKFLGGAGTQTAALAFGGAMCYLFTATEEYDGTSWTTRKFRIQQNICSRLQEYKQQL